MLYPAQCHRFLSIFCAILATLTLNCPSSRYQFSHGQKA